MAQRESDEHDQPSTIDQKSSLVQCPKCLNGSDRTEQDLKSSNSGLSTNIQKAQHISEKESIILCPEHRGPMINPTCQRDNIITSSNDDSNFENVLDELKVNRSHGDKKRSLESMQELEKMKSDPSQSYQVEDQNQNTSDEDEEIKA
jgi:hypothetical protein